MNGLDIAIIAIVGIGAFGGLARGVLRMATAVLSLALGIYAAWAYYGRAAVVAQRYLSTSPTVSALIGYVAVFAIVFFAVEYAGTTVVRLAQIIHVSWIDRLAGGLLGASIGALIAGFVVFGLTALLPPNPSLVRDSKLAPQVLGYSEVLIGYVPPQVKQTFEEKRAELYRQWLLKAQALEKQGSGAKIEGPETSPSPAR